MSANSEFGHVAAVGVKRPGQGTAGRPIPVEVNCYVVDAPNITIYQYDAIDPDKLPIRANMEIFRQVEQENPTIFTKPMAYDGRKIAYAALDLPLGSTSRTFEVTLAPKNGGTDPKPQGRPPRVYKLKLTQAATINTDVLHRYVSGQQSLDTAVATSLAAYNTIIRMEPNLRFPFNVRSFFTPDGARPIGGGIELWRGFFQSIRPGPGRLLLNLDIATCMMYRTGPLVDLCLDFFDRQDLMRSGNFAQFLSPNGLSERERIRLQKFLTNLRVTVPGSTRDKKRGIKRLSDRGAAQITFEYQGQNVTVARYFQLTGQQIRYPQMFCVELGTGGALVPLELCQVPPGQIMRKQLPSDKTKAMVEFSTQKPHERFQSIRNGAQQLAYGQSDYIREFGMNINTAGGLMQVQARVLPTPVLQYGAGSREVTVMPKFGAWNMADKKLIAPSTVHHWLVFSFDSRRFREPGASEMIKNMVRGFESTGIVMSDKQPIIKNGNPQGDIGAQLRAAGTESYQKKKTPPQLIVIVLPDQGNTEIYTAVKHFGDVAQGVATQCLKAGKCVGANIQYWANVALKVNVKLGGINWNPQARSAPILADPNNPVIIMGADVQHPAPGAEGRPSFTAVVGSVDALASKYVATSALQVGRQELIDDLKAMCKEVIQTHISYRQQKEGAKNPAPRKLIFFRDGVSEGQFDQVLQAELPLIQEACRELNIRPQITLLVVIKRHHIRMNPMANADRTGNCPAGTILDTGITSPVEFDWYLQSHGGLLGTSRPAHYADNRFSADTLQALAFTLCHVYARATRSVSIPAPVYYADIVCARGKHHFEPGMQLQLSDTVSQTGSVDTFRQAYMPIHNNMKRLMFFSVCCSVL
ncbi:Piwi-domain-containing protein [Macrolepiota fuliginosa MF-IS2]|uniref:Piwi-domain-containing protein n=1 Tax=Macrolepiota fuliginosa MF-IS2 TaxID=1400762 RepID=A0A9P6BXN4_9AGAR|nr:Piwi-domain-containing protein [Macrolepiota fuliginosa MF-IS2]